MTQCDHRQSRGRPISVFSSNLDTDLGSISRQRSHPFVCYFPLGADPNAFVYTASVFDLGYALLRLDRTSAPLQLIPRLPKASESSLDLTSRQSLIYSPSSAKMLGFSYYHGQIAVAHFICCLIAGLTVCTRIYAKKSTKQGLRRDDYLILWTLIVYWTAIIVALHGRSTPLQQRRP